MSHSVIHSTAQYGQLFEENGVARSCSELQSLLSSEVFETAALGG